MDHDPIYLSLGQTSRERARCYHDFVRSGIVEEEWQLIRDAIQRGQLTGSDRFIEEIQARIGKRIESHAPGRPKNKTDIKK